MKIEHILVVCVGNICRSPLAEYFLRQALPHCQISSAGLAAVTGADMDAAARKAAEAAGVQVPPHTARQLTLALCQAADLILVMEGAHREGVSRLHPPARAKTFLLAHGEPEPDIPDPYRQSAATHAAVHRQIHAACQAWLTKLTPRG